MSKSLVGRVKNKNFAFFWLLIGGSIGNLLLILYSLSIWEIFLPSALLSVLIAMAVADKTHRPRLWLGTDLLLSFILLIFFVHFFWAKIRLALLPPTILIILGCIIGIMNW